jgi:hypothetical protein
MTYGLFPTLGRVCRSPRAFYRRCAALRSSTSGNARRHFMGAIRTGRLPLHRSTGYMDTHVMRRSCNLRSTWVACFCSWSPPPLSRQLSSRRSNSTRPPLGDGRRPRVPRHQPGSRVRVRPAPFARRGRRCGLLVTAHDVHALRALEIKAVDYLMKPVESARLALRRRSPRTCRVSIAAGHVVYWLCITSVV